MTVNNITDLAIAQIGYREKLTAENLDRNTAPNDGAGNFTKYARDLDALGDVYNFPKNGFDWCDIFVDWLFIHTFGKEVGTKMLYQPLKGCGAGCGFSANYYRAKRKFYARPQVGDQIFFGSEGDEEHTGIVVEVTDSSVVTVEGNVGQKVVRKVYPKGAKNIVGYGRPDWSLVPDDEPVVEKRYHTLGDLKADAVANRDYYPTIKMLLDRRILEGKGGAGDGRIIDFGEDAIRVFVTNNRAGLYNQ